MKIGISPQISRNTFRTFGDGLLLSGNAPSGFPFSGLRRGSYRVDLAQSIRDGAGVPASEETGIQSGVTVGLTNAGGLSSGSKLNIANETNIQNIADSGTGTQSDPYIVEDRDYDGGGSTNWGHRFTDSSGDYYIKFRNCWFHDYTSQCLWFDTATNVKIEFENCEFSNSSANAELCLHEVGEVTLTNCLISGCNSFAGYLMGGSHSGSLAIRNLQIDESRETWANNSTPFYINQGNSTLDVKYVQIENGYTNQLEAVFEVLGCGAGSYIGNADCDANGDINHFISDHSNTASQKGLTLEYLNIYDFSQEIIHLRALNNSIIRKSFVGHVTWGSGYRTIFLFSDSSDDTMRIENVDVSFVKVTKSAGGAGAGNEAVESARAENCRFMNCWVTECTEDAFEHIAVVSGCTVEYCVADNCTGQIVDIFKQQDASTWSQIDSVFGSENAVNSETYIHHIYGDCSDYVVTIDGMRGCIFHDIYATNTDSSTNQSVRIQDRDSIVVRDVYGAGPLPLQSERGNGTSTNAVLVTGGADIEVNFYDNQSGSGSLTTVTN